MTRPLGPRNRRHISRRQFLSPLPLLPWMRSGRAWAKSIAGQVAPQIITKEGSPSAWLTITPNERFFIRNHFTAPRLSAKDWKLRLTGKVRSPREITYAELLGRSSRTLTVTLECAGNGVGFDGVGTATWEGVSLATLIEEAGLMSSVKQIRLVGADRGAEASSATPISFSRSISLEKASHPDTLLAFRMNGAPLTTGTRFSCAGDCARLVWDGLCEVACPGRGAGPQRHELLHGTELCRCSPESGRFRARASYQDASEVFDRPGRERVMSSGPALRRAREGQPVALMNQEP